MPSSIPPTGQDANARSIANSFEQPEWYLKGYATNIRIRAETVLSVMHSRKCDRILDIGCGDGSLSLPLLHKAKHATFLDQSRAMLEKVRASVADQPGLVVEYIPSGFMEAKLPLDAFDLIICVGVLAYVEDVETFLGKIATLLARDGLLVLECTDSNHFLSRLDRAYQSVTGLVKVRPFDIHHHAALEVLKDANSNGFHLAEIFRYTYSLPLLSRIIPGSATYNLIRSVFGNIFANCRSSFGNQCILVFSRPSPTPMLART